jgi:thiosulfate/3-mercaptopyruvate sulfurtransferase
MQLKGKCKLVISILILLFILFFGTAVAVTEIVQHNYSISSQQVEPDIVSASNNSDETLTSSIRFTDALVSPLMVSGSDVVLDISPNATKYVNGAVNINYEKFLGEGGSLKPVSEISRILGEAGISRNDSLVITGECLPCGGGPSPAVFSYWLLKYLGHDSVRVLDGGIGDWEAAGLNTSDKPAIRPKTNYVPSLRPELLATYDFVVNGGAQVVDARPARDFGMGSIPGAVNIPYENVLENGRIKREADLEEVFSILRKDKPAVVYTNVGIEASLVWLALDIMGYDARLYSWRDWLENQPKFNFELVDAEAKPNPVRSREATTITASFKEKSIKATENSSPKGEIKLTVKGCVTCGFEGFSLGSANVAGNNSGVIQLGSSSKTTQSTGVTVQASNSALRCTAIVNGPDGSEVARTSLLRTSGYRYMGIWNANVAPGVYRVSISASASGNAEVFKDVLEIEVTG